MNIFLHHDNLKQFNTIVNIHSAVVSRWLVNKTGVTSISQRETTGLTKFLRGYYTDRVKRVQISFFKLRYYIKSYIGTMNLSSIWNRRRKCHPTPVLLPGKSHGWRSLVGCSPWGRWVRYDWATSLSLFIFMHWRRKWQPTPVFLSGES